ncbi:hypothetical protein BDZ89DRAFT_1037574 [Hymenopellis radicata]|nr:hypothetical protein BDZ89DRAFT_1037574 [Hymenopellis radicata]
MSILNGQREWARGYSSGSSEEVVSRLRITNPDYPDFVFEERSDGEGYTISDFNNKASVVSHTSSSLLELVVRDAKAGSQMWTVECSTCDSPNYSTGHYAGLGCKIINVNNSFCVQTGPKLDDPMYIATCGNGFDQLFDFWVHADQ